jgi:hypothetical protein
MIILPLSNSWLSSNNAQRVYLACAYTLLYAAILAPAWMPATEFLDTTVLEESAIVRTIVILNIMAVSVAFAVLYVGMWYHVLQATTAFEHNGFWILVLIVFGELGAVLYYVLRYRKSCAQEAKAKAASAMAD